MESDIRLENLEELKTVTRTFEEKEGIVSLEDFLLEVSLVTDVTEYNDDKNRVSLMTVHSVKGLEYDYVFIVGLEEGIFPHMNSLMNNSDLEEERRLCYVAITRAKEKLYIISARSRMLFGHESINLPSRFINEINKDLIDGFVPVIKEEAESKIDVDKMFYKEDANYKKDDYVYHEVFGQGKVLDVNGSVVTIAFKHPYGIKKLMKNHKSLSKV